MKQRQTRGEHIDATLRRAIEFLKGNFEISKEFLEPLEKGEDPHGICLDFVTYMKAMDDAEKDYFSREKGQKWTTKSICCVANSGAFSSDRTVSEYSEEIWGAVEISIPKGVSNPN